MNAEKLLRGSSRLLPSTRSHLLEPAHIEDVCSKYAHVKNTANLALGAARWGPPEEALRCLATPSPTWSKYSDGMGLPALRAQILASHGLADGESDVMVTCGANQAFVNVALCLLDVDDIAVLVAPYYFSHKAAVELAGASTEVTPFEPDTLQPDIRSITNPLLGKSPSVSLTSDL